MIHRRRHGPTRSAGLRSGEPCGRGRLAAVVAAAALLVTGLGGVAALLPTAAAAGATGRTGGVGAAGAAMCPPPGDVDDALEAVARVAVPGARGSGVLIDRDTVVTAAHVVDEADPVAEAVRVTWASGEMVRASVDAVNPTADLALLELRRRPAACPLALAGARADVGGDVHAAGYPRGAADLAVSRGVVAGHPRDAQVRLLRIEAPVDAGMSGGAVLDGDLRVAGIILARHADARRVSFAVAVSHVAALVDGDPATAATGQAAGPIEPASTSIGPTPIWLALTALAGLLVAGLLRRHRRRERHRGPNAGEPTGAGGPHARPAPR